MGLDEGNSQTAKIYNKTGRARGKGEWGAVINDSWNGGNGLALAEGTAVVRVCNMWNTLNWYTVLDFGPSNNLVGYSMFS